MSPPILVAVHRSPTHSFSKVPQLAISLLAGRGVEGDAHCGATVRHRYLRRRDPSSPNLMQVHLLASEFLDALRLKSSAHDPSARIDLLSGQLGENLTTRGFDLEDLPLATRLHLGCAAVVELTGLRTPCTQMNALHPGLMRAAFQPGTRLPRAGVMAIVVASGELKPGDAIRVELPAGAHRPLQPI